MKRGGRRDVGVGRTKAPARQRCPTASSTPTVWVGSGGRGDWRGRGGGERERERVERSIFEEEDGGGRAFLNLCPRMPLDMQRFEPVNRAHRAQFRRVAVQHRAMGIGGALPDISTPILQLVALLKSASR